MQILHQRRDRLIVGAGAELHRLEAMLVHGVIVPVLHAAAERTAEAGRQDFDAGFHQPPGSSSC